MNVSSVELSTPLKILYVLVNFFQSLMENFVKHNILFTNLFIMSEDYSILQPDRTCMGIVLYLGRGRGEEGVTHNRFPPFT